ncbi:MAG: UDP-N-acetylmuramoyl-tripeptide--D-alanyl-D-alanine ligase [Ignavibacteriales bacterium]
MMHFTASEVARICGGRLLSGDPGTLFTRVVTDSRDGVAGALFVALRGERLDGHEFVPDAIGRGASGALVSTPPGEGLAGAAVVQVEDALVALGRLAAAHRLKFKGLVVGVTGSVGKTTAKEMISAVLSVRFKVAKNEGNMNTEIGVPISVFNLSEDYDAGVFELAMRLKGEITYLAGIVRPQIGVITNISETHLERLGTRENIALAKAELLEALPADGLAVLNGDNEWIRRIRSMARCRVVLYGMEPGAEVRAAGVAVDENGTSFDLLAGGRSTRCFIGIPGGHHVHNALAAACVGLHCGLGVEEIAEGLRAFRQASMRSEFIDAGGIRFINDAYNASPVSTKAALTVLSQVAAGRRVAVLGNMLELGDYTVPGHRETGEAVAGNGIDVLVAVGNLASDIAGGALAAGMPGSRVHRCKSNGDAVILLKDLLKPGDTVLVKGSRGARMEEILDALLEGESCST